MNIILVSFKSKEISESEDVEKIEDENNDNDDKKDDKEDDDDEEEDIFEGLPPQEHNIDYY